MLKFLVELAVVDAVRQVKTAMALKKDKEVKIQQLQQQLEDNCIL